MDSIIKRIATPYERFWEILPAVMEWSTFALLFLLSWLAPFLVSYFIILFSLYWLVKAIHVSFHLAHTYFGLKQVEKYNWQERLQSLDDPGKALILVTSKLAEIQNIIGSNRLNLKKRREVRALQKRRQELVTLVHRADKMPLWRDVWHLVVLTTYNEPVEVLKESIEALRQSKYPMDHVIVLVGLEERAGPESITKAAELEAYFKGKFAHFWTVLHPDGIAGEAKVKSANATYALKTVLPKIEKLGINKENILVSNLDADTQVHKDYLAVLTEAFIIEPDRQHSSFQPIPVYHNNYWTVPMLSRVSAIGSTFWQMIEASRSQRLVSFSSHAIPLQAVINVGGWDVSRISEDSRIFWQCCVYYKGNYKAVPLLVTVSMDAVQAGNWWQTLVNLYKQKRRWAWGAENLAYLGVNFFSRNGQRIPLKQRLLHTLRMVEAFYTWGTAAIILAIGGWLPGALGGAEFNNTVLGQNFLSVSRSILTIALLGVLVSIIVSIKMIPPRPKGLKRRKILSVVFQWILTPLVTIIFGSIPALDAHTRLALGKYMEFQVMPKVRTSDSSESKDTENKLAASDAN